MATARNPDGQVTAVQLTFLDSETGKKASLDVAKKSFGVLKGSAVILQENPSGPLFIAEGVETALSLKSAGVEGTIQANLGLSNIKQLSPQKPETPVVICADHDEPESPAAKGLEKSVQTLQDKGFHVTVIKPEKLNQDFNDVLKEKGPQGVREILQKSLPEHIFQNQVAQENPFDKIRLLIKPYRQFAVMRRGDKQIHYAHAVSVPGQIINNVCPDKPGTAGNKHEVICRSSLFHASIFPQQSLMPRGHREHRDLAPFFLLRPPEIRQTRP